MNRHHPSEGQITPVTATDKVASLLPALAAPVDLTRRRLRSALPSSLCLQPRSIHRVSLSMDPSPPRAT